MRALLEDVRALEKMLAGDSWFESDIRRMAPNRRCSWSTAAAPGQQVARDPEGLPDESFTTELGQFNMEINLSPQELAGDCLSRMELELETLLGQARKRGRGAGGPHPPDRDPADAREARPRPRLDDADPALLPAEPDHARAPGRGVPHADQGAGRAADHARQRHARGLQHELPGPLPGGATGVRDAVQRGPGRHGTGAGGGGQLTGPPCATASGTRRGWPCSSSPWTRVPRPTPCAAAGCAWPSATTGSRTR